MWDSDLRDSEAISDTAVPWCGDTLLPGAAEAPPSSRPALSPCCPWPLSFLLEKLTLFQGQGGTIERGAVR